MHPPPAAAAARAPAYGPGAPRQEPWIATLDADGQNDPANIPQMLGPALRGGPIPILRLVAGWRRAPRHLAERVSSRAANRVRAAFLKDSTPDTGWASGLSRIFPAPAPISTTCTASLPALVIRAGGEVVSVPVNHRPRTLGVSKYGFHNRLWVGIVDLFGVAWLQRRAKVPVVERITGGEGKSWTDNLAHHRPSGAGALFRALHHPVAL